MFVWFRKIGLMEKINEDFMQHNPSYIPHANAVVPVLPLGEFGLLEVSPFVPLPKSKFESASEILLMQVHLDPFH